MQFKSLPVVLVLASFRIPLALAQDASTDIQQCRTTCKEKPEVINSDSFLSCVKNGTQLKTEADTRTRCTCRDVKLFFDVQTCMASTCPSLSPKFRDECDNFTLNGATTLSTGGLLGVAVTGVALLLSLGF